jgi:hypothetical protein
LQRILIIQVQEIEGKENDPVRRCVDGRTEGVEVRKPILILDHHLTIEHPGLAGQLR